MTGRAILQWGLTTVTIGAFMLGAGCASKQVASTSGDQSVTLKSKAEPGPVEALKQEPLATVDAGGPGTPATSSPAPGSGSMPSSSLVPEGAQTQLKAPSPADAASLGDIYFDYDKYNIRSDAQTTLGLNATILRARPGTSVVVEGHCDERGTLAYNLVLGEKRAKSAKRYLEDLGIPGSRIQTTSYGEVRPFCKEHNDGCWSKNRRAHFVVR